MDPGGSPAYHFMELPFRVKGSLLLYRVIVFLYDMMWLERSGFPLKYFIRSRVNFPCRASHTKSVDSGLSLICGRILPLEWMWLNLEGSKLSCLGLLRGALILVLAPRECTIDDISASITPAYQGVSMMTVMRSSRVFEKPILVTDTSMVSRAREDLRLNRCLSMSSKAARFAYPISESFLYKSLMASLNPPDYLSDRVQEFKHGMGRGAFLWDESWRRGSSSGGARPDNS